MSDERRAVLAKLLTFAGELGSIHAELNRFEWDCDEALIHLKAEHVFGVLERFRSGELSAEKVEDWANTIECRDDIDFEPSQEDALKEAIFLLANPVINEPISSQLASRIEKSLGKGKGVA